MTMREKIARAMEAAADNWLAGEAKDGMRWNGMADVPLEILADAALSAMREPSDAMVEAGCDCGENIGFEIAISECRTICRAMIDAAIQEKGE